MMQELLIKTGIPSYVTNFITTVPTQNQLNIQIAKAVTPQQIGFIFGLTQLTDSTSPTKNTLITSADAANMYLVFKDGPTEFFQQIRLDQMIRSTPGYPNQNPTDYLPVAIPGNFDLSTSFYINPTGVVSTTGEGAVMYEIFTQLWFISTDSYMWLMEKGYIDKSYAEQFIKKKNRM